MIKRLFHTLRPLKWEQYWYRLANPVRALFYSKTEVPENAINSAAACEQSPLFHLPVFDNYTPENNSFCLLNIPTFYPKGIDWNDTNNGMLWAYHLNYFNWLEDENISVAARLKTIDAYLDNKAGLKIGHHPYPTSLRAINWIRFLVRAGKQQNSHYNKHLYQHCHHLYTFPEYHLQGNHLWENGCSLLLAGQYFNDPRFYDKGRKILSKALREQIFDDGGHIEGSPVYHSLLLSRLLQYLEFVKYNNRIQDSEFSQTITAKAALMLGWLEAVTFTGNHLPMVNDAAFSVAPDLATLRAYASLLGIHSRVSVLSDSGYRMWRHQGTELFIDIANITPAYQPGHTHADTFSFCISVNGKPHIIDPGTSTYETSSARSFERSTAAHNTISINKQNSSDVWKSFRIGKRATVHIIDEKNNFLSAAHSGYKNLGVLHKRAFSYVENKIIVEDVLEGLGNHEAQFYLHFHKEIILKNIDNSKFLAGNLLLEIEGAKNICIEPYLYAEGFNKTCTSKRICISVSAATKLTIETQHAD